MQVWRPFHAEAWRSVLDNPIARGLRQFALLIVEGGQGLEKTGDRLFNFTSLLTSQWRSARTAYG